MIIMGTKTEKLETVTKGWQKGNFIVIAGCMKMGKTAFALSLVHNMAVKKNIPLAMFSLEMPTEQLMTRLKKICDQEDESFDINEAPFYVDDTPSLSVSELQAKAWQWVNEHQVKMIIVDYIQLMNASDHSCNSRKEEITIISHALKSLAKELDIPIIALSWLHLPVEKDRKRPRLCDLRESDVLAEDADLVYLIHRPEFYRVFYDQYGNDMRGVAEIITAKHPDGERDNVYLYFSEEHGMFMDEKEQKKEKEMKYGQILAQYAAKGLMQTYKIDDDVCMGWACSGPVYEEGHGTVELSDEEVDTLVQLIREKGTTDVEELELESSHPELYKKLFDAYQKMEHEAQLRHWLWRGYKEGEYNEKIDILKAYCKEHCDFVYEEEPYMGRDEEDEEEFEENENEAFWDWFSDCICTADSKMLETISYQVLEEEEIEDNEPYVQIPPAIVEKAKEATK